MTQFGFEIEPRGKTPNQIDQIHSGRAVEYKKGGETPKADAIWTSGNDAIYVFTADCLPVLLYSENRVAAIHCGWRGALEGVVKNTVNILGISNANLHAQLGPCLKKCCFEVREDFIQTFAKKGFTLGNYLENRSDRKYFDLIAWVCDTQLAGVPNENLSVDPRCTYCDLSKLPSFRRNGSTDPRIRSWISKI